jgi:predicted dehydrogenase
MAGRKAIMVGTGGISRAWFPGIKKENVELVALVDLNPELARERAEQQELANVMITDDLGKALAETDADFAIDLTVPAAHCQVVCQCLEAGLDVIGEKPMAETMDQCRRMVDTAARTGRRYMVSQSRRYNATHQRIADTIRSGALGQVTSVHCDFFMGCHFGGFRDEMKSVLLNDMSIHHFDLARMFIDADPLSVFAEEYNPAGSWYAHGPNANCLFEMTDDIRFTYCGSWCAEGCHTSWNGDWRIVGTKGTLIYRRDEQPVGQVVTGDEGFNRPLEPLELAEAQDLPGNQHGALIEFLAALDGGPPPQGDSADNIKSMAMVCYAIDSAAQDKRLAIKI